MSMTFKYGVPFPPRQQAAPEEEPEAIRAKYGVPFPPRQQAAPGGQGRDIAGRLLYEQGLVEGRRQILTWMGEALDTLLPMAQPTNMGMVLFEGLRRQIVKYLLSGGNPLEKDGGESGDG